jgi:hypothetical protein
MEPSGSFIKLQQNGGLTSEVGAIGLQVGAVRVSLQGLSSDYLASLLLKLQ